MNCNGWRLPRALVLATEGTGHSLPSFSLCADVKKSVRNCERKWMKHARLGLICLMFCNNHAAHFRKMWPRPLHPASSTKYGKSQRVVRLCAFSSSRGSFFCPSFDFEIHALMRYFFKQERIQRQGKLKAKT